jgi:hypothetical protein
MRINDFAEMEDKAYLSRQRADPFIFFIDGRRTSEMDRIYNAD